MRNCRKCNEIIPTRTVIEGKERNLKNRKFCLNCSPFGKHNTKSDDPSRKPVFGQINGKKLSYSEWSESAKEANRAHTWKKRQDRMQKLIDYKGGSCNICGYNKCNRALCFHHVNSEEKSFELNSRTMACKSWASLLKEADKCELLCHNCHMELHEQKYTSKYAKYFE